jgi:ABC-type Fe3+/spermidine/putrescine transport system ATPase subunit
MSKMTASTKQRSNEAIAERCDDIAVRFERVSKRFNEVNALCDFSLAVRRGEFMTLLGPSGCGKTTLLNLVAGFFGPDEGQIFIAERLVNGVPTYKREIGMMFQNYALFPHLTVMSNVAYGLRARHLGRPEITCRVGAALSLVKLSGLEDRRPRQLSGGQQQRVALARALVINPKVLLLDEPFSALDKHLRASMQIELREIQRKLGLTTIFVTHDQGEALSLSDRVAVISEGRIRQVGTPDGVYTQPCERFVASFVGDGNILRGRLVGIDGSWAMVALGALKIRVPSDPLLGTEPSGPVDLFIRPEQLSLTDLGKDCATSGAIVSHVYQGGHVDLRVECADSVHGHLLIRLSGPQAKTGWPIGARVAVSVNGSEAIAFAVGQAAEKLPRNLKGATDRGCNGPGN